MLASSIRHPKGTASQRGGGDPVPTYLVKKESLCDAGYLPDPRDPILVRPAVAGDDMILYLASAG